MDVLLSGAFFILLIGAVLIWLVICLITFIDAMSEGMTLRRIKIVLFSTLVLLGTPSIMWLVYQYMK